MFYSKDEKKKLVSSYIYEGKSLEDLAVEYHLPIFVIKLWVKKYTNDVVSERWMYYRTTEAPSEELMEKIEELSTEELVADVEYMSHVSQDYADAEEDDVMEVENDKSAFPKSFPYSIASRDSFPDLLKFRDEKIIEIVVLFLQANNTIHELAEIYEVSELVIFSWIILYFDEAEKIIKRRKSKVALGKVSRFAYTKKFRYVICKMYRMGLSSVDIQHFFNIASTTVLSWNKSFDELDNEYIDLDTIVDDYLVRKKAAKVFEETKNFNASMKNFLIENRKETIYEEP